VLTEVNRFSRMRTDQTREGGRKERGIKFMGENVDGGPWIQPVSSQKKCKSRVGAGVKEDRRARARGMENIGGKVESAVWCLEGKSEESVWLLRRHLRKCARRCRYAPAGEGRTE